jgi:ubiquitin-activating enzyme E1
MGNIQCIIPHVTECYSSSTDPPERNVPVCTLRHFPNAIEHTIQWARDKFEGLFTNSMIDSEKFLSDENYLDELTAKCTKSTLETLESIKKSLIDEKPKDFQDCVAWARTLFEELYTNQIRQLLFNFPPDQIMPKSGQPFWSGAKKKPSPIIFDVNQRLHIDFILSAANLRAEMYGIEQNRNYMSIIEFLQKITVPTFEPQEGIKIPVNDAELEEGNGDEKDDGDVDEMLIKQLRNDVMYLNKSEPEMSATLTKIHALHFEKDDDTNLHMDFVTAASNLRAANYKIPPVDKFKTKLIAGKIIAAIATCTSIVAGFVCLEIYKIAQG